MGARKATATGKLSSTPFCELLVYALTEGLTGSLVLESPDRVKHAVLLSEGVPVKAKVAAPETRLGDVLSARGDVDAAARRAAGAGPEKQLFGQRLLAQGALEQDALNRGLVEQVLSQMAWLARLPEESAFGYYANADFLENWAGEKLAVDPLQAIWRAVDANAPLDRVERAVAGVSGRVLRLHPASRVSRFAFSSRERSVVDVLRVKPQSMADLEATGLLERPALRRVVYALVLTRHLDIGAEPLAVTRGVTVVSASPGGVNLSARPARRASGELPQTKSTPLSGGQPRSRGESGKESQQALHKSQTPAPARAGLSEEQIVTKLNSLETVTHYELLGLPMDASSAAVTAAFPALARVWHPDKLRPEQSSLRDAMTRIFARMTEANAVLGHAESRSQYDQGLFAQMDEDQEQEQVSRVLRAAEAFQKAEILMRKRDLPGAEQLAKMAYEGDADQPEYVALYGWIRSRRADCTDDEREQLVSLLKGAVDRQSDNPKIRYYYGCVLKRVGRQTQALREFKFVADRDPSNLEAARELRVHQMRHRHSHPAASGGGFFDRIFKR